MREFLNKLVNKLFDLAETQGLKWYYRPAWAIAVVLCIVYMAVSELVTGKSFFYPNHPKRDQDENPEKSP